MESNKNTKATKRWFWIAIISSWLTYVFFSYVVIGIALWVVVLTILILRKSDLKWKLLGFSSWTLIPTIIILLGTTDYFRGQASLKYVGLPGLKFYNLEPEYRVWKTTSGCTPLGFEPYTNSLNNTVVKFWTNLLGVQNNVYSGVYPNELETKELINSQSDTVKYTLNQGEFSFLLNNISYRMKNPLKWKVLEDRDTALAKVAYLGEDLLVFKPIQVVEDKYEMTYLSDKRTGNIFARYH